MSSSLELTFLSVICIIPDKLLPGRACFRLYRQHEEKNLLDIGKISIKKTASKMSTWKDRLKNSIKNVHYSKISILSDDKNRESGQTDKEFFFISHL